MSTKALERMLSLATRGVATDAIEDRGANAELGAIRSAAKALAESGWLMVIQEERGITKAEADAAFLLASIAKEAP
jgi:hypothetical protein